MNISSRSTLFAATVAAILLVPGFSVKAAPATPQGIIAAKEFLDIGGVTIAELTNNAKFPNNPDLINYSTLLEWPANEDGSQPPGNVKNNYGVQIVGYFYPTTTGPHTFYIAADDYARLWLSTDSTAANKKLIAIEPEWNPVRDFMGTARRDVTNPQNVSSTYQATEWPGGAGAPINLTAGQAYYIEAVMKEGGGGDNLAVSLDGSVPIPGTMLSTIDKTLGPVSITTQPQSQTILEGTPVTFSVVADGTPLFPSYGYQWKKGGVDITDATNRTYSIQFTSATDAGPYTVTVTGAVGAPVTSAPATLTVTADTTRPTVVSAAGGSASTSPLGGVTVTFSERMDPVSVAVAANYTISGGVTVSGVIVLSDAAVVLRTSAQTANTLYTLTVNNVKDRAAAGNPIAPNSAAQFNSAQFLASAVQFEVWNGGIAITDLTNNLADGAFGRAPDNSFQRALFESGRDFNDNYGARGYAWFKAPASGDYVFYVTADDNARLYLSTDDNPANKKNIAAEQSWSNNRDWTLAIGTEQASDSYTDTEWPTGNTITLVQNQYYYLEAQWQEGGGGDGAEVTYKLSSEADPVTPAASRLTGANTGVFSDPATRPPQITTRPTGVVYSKGDTINFTVTAIGPAPLTYQWAKGGVAIPGATSNPYVIPNADHTAIGDYSVTVSNPNGTANTLPDNDARAIMRGAFLIEAEDFNFDGGQTTNVASVMPYLGNAYTNLTSRSVLDVDFFHDPDNSGGDINAYAYGRFDMADAGTIEIKGPADPADYVRGDFSVTVNYALGWTTTAEWQNYTRTFPSNTYVVYMGAAHDGRAANEINIILSRVATPTIPDNSAIGTEGGAQGLTRLGTFLGPATGAWSSNDMFPLREGTGTGPIAQIQLGGTQTLRVTFNSVDGDADFLLFYPVTIGPRITSVSITGGQVTVVWTGGGTLFSTPSLTTPATWTTTGDSDGSYTATVGAGNLFFRAQQ